MLSLLRALCLLLLLAPALAKKKHGGSNVRLMTLHLTLTHSLTLLLALSACVLTAEYRPRVEKQAHTV
jgi:hypothetical protein